MGIQNLISPALNSLLFLHIYTSLYISTHQLQLEGRLYIQRFQDLLLVSLCLAILAAPRYKQASLTRYFCRVVHRLANYSPIGAPIVIFTPADLPEFVFSSTPDGQRQSVYLDRGCGGFQPHHTRLDKKTGCHMTFQRLPKNRLAGDQGKVGVPS